MSVAAEFQMPPMLKRFGLYMRGTILTQAQYPTIHTMAVLILESKSPDYARRAAAGSQQESNTHEQLDRAFANKETGGDQPQKHALVATKDLDKHTILLLNEGFFVSKAFRRQTNRAQPMRVVELTDDTELSKYLTFEVAESPAWNIAIVPKV